jgi:hypothetical protein
MPTVMKICPQIVETLPNGRTLIVVGNAHPTTDLKLIDLIGLADDEVIRTATGGIVGIDVDAVASRLG